MLLKSLVNAVADELEKLVLPKHTLYRHARPLSLAGHAGVGQHLPALAVFPMAINPDIMSTTSEYEHTHQIGITWYHGQMKAVTSGSPTVIDMETAMDAVSTLIGGLTVMAVGVPGISPQTELTIGAAHFGVIEGGIWACEITTSVLSWEL